MEPLYIRPEVRCRRSEPLPAEADLLLACLRSEAFAEDLPEADPACANAIERGTIARRPGLVRTTIWFIATRLALPLRWRALVCAWPRRHRLHAG